MKPYRVWKITEHPSKGHSSESFDDLPAAIGRAKELSTDGDGWLVGSFSGYDSEDWASFTADRIVFDQCVYVKENNRRLRK